MMGERRIGQEGLFYEFSLERHVPVEHLLRSIDRFVDLDGVRCELAPFYSELGRPSIDPELMIRMLVVGYCFGIRSERRLCEEVHLNLGYRWFCRLGLDGKVSTSAVLPTSGNDPEWHGYCAQSLRQPMPVSGAPTHWFSGSSPGNTVYGTTGNDQLAGNGTATLVGDGGDDTFIVYGPGDVVIEAGNSGISTIESWGSGYTLPANVQNLTLQGSADAYAVGNSLNNIITANSGNDRIIAGTGNDILAGGSGNDTFVVSAGDGVDEIQNFHAGDVVALHSTTQR